MQPEGNCFGALREETLLAMSTVFSQSITPRDASLSYTFHADA